MHSTLEISEIVVCSGGLHQIKKSYFWHELFLFNLVGIGLCDR